ncbi:MAG: response regulator [Opitutaceae bacterium]
MGFFGKKKEDAASLRAKIKSLKEQLAEFEDGVEEVEEAEAPAVAPAPAGQDQQVSPMMNLEGEEREDLGSSSNPLFATLSHELRTPLNGVLGMAQLLKEEFESPKLETLESCAQHMQSVLHTLVNLSKIQEQWGNLPEHREWINLHDICEQIKKNISRRALSRRLVIKMEHENDSIRLRGDYDHLINIIETALLGSLECVDLDANVEQETLNVSWKLVDGSVEIKIENPLELMPENRGLRIFEVNKLTTSDDHARIRMEYLYWSVSISLLEHYEGAMMATKMNGDHGVKTILRFNMESMEASPSKGKPIGGLSLESKKSGKTALPPLPFSLNVLVVEDDPISRDLMSMLLERIGQKVKVASNGQLALDMLENGETFDLIFMDIDMPVLDGMMASREIRMREMMEELPKTPIVAVTAFNTLSDQSKFKKAGMDYFLCKPVSLKDMRSVLIEVTRKEKEGK